VLADSHERPMEEQSMIEDDPRGAADDESSMTPATFAKHASSEAAADERPDSPTKGMLREAIQKVLEEIAHHETEAKKHLQQAQELRKDLRDSFSFLQDRGPKGKPVAASVESPAAKATEPTATPENAPMGRRHRRSGRKKARSARKSAET
jgi:hypothetical protein